MGGLDNVPASLFAAFDYVALGHIHKRQKIGMGEVWYAGSPLKYSFSEANQEKSVNIVTLKEKGSISVERKKLTPLHEMRVIRGKLEQLITPEVVIDPIGTLRSVYPNVMQIVPDKNGQKEEEEYRPAVFAAQRSTGELFAQFYEMLRGEPMDRKREKLVEEVEKELGSEG